MTKQNSNCFHRQCLAVHYQAYQEQDIIRFIEQVILNKQDPLKEQRYKFYEQAIKENYPNTSSVILHHILHNLFLFKHILADTAKRADIIIR